MNGFEKMLSKWNFKKIAVIYVTLAVLALIACGVAVGVLYRERIAFAISYSRLEELCEKKNPSEEELKSAMERTARSSSNVIDVILVDKEGAVLFSAMGSEMAKAIVDAWLDAEYIGSGRHERRVNMIEEEAAKYNK